MKKPLALFYFIYIFFLSLGSFRKLFCV